MGKQRYSDKERERLRELNINIPDEQGSLIVGERQNDQFLQTIEQYRHKTALEILEKAFGKDNQFQTSRETLTDDDEELRTYDVTRDNAGEVVRKYLLDPIEGIHLQDYVVPSDNTSVSLGIKDREGADLLNDTDPRKKEIYRDRLFSSIRKTIDPTTGEISENTQKSFLDAALDGSMIFKAFSFLDRKTGAFGDSDKYGLGLSPSNDAFKSYLNNLDFKKDGVYYENVKIIDDPNETQLLSDLINKTATFKSSGLLESAAVMGLSLAIDFGMFALGGNLTSKAIGTVFPGIEAVTDILPKIPIRYAQMFGTLAIYESPKLVEDTYENGVTALLEDLQHIGAFSMFGTAFGIAGEQIGIGASRLLQASRNLNMNQAVTFLKRNPRVYQTLIEGFSSAGLGYVTTPGSKEEKLASALVFATMHFASPRAWNTFLTGKQKDIMVENDGYEVLYKALHTPKKVGIKVGVEGETEKTELRSRGLFEAIKDMQTTVPKYFLREKNNLYEINLQKFIREGLVEKISEEPTIRLNDKTAGGYRYITETLPFAKKTWMQGLQDGRRLKRLAEVDKKFRERVRNPFDPKTQEKAYENFEYSRAVMASHIADMLYAVDLERALNKNEIPRGLKFDDFLSKESERMSYPDYLFRKQISSTIIDYIKDAEGVYNGEMRFLPKDVQARFKSGFEAVLKDYEDTAYAKRFENLNSMLRVRRDLQNGFGETVFQRILQGRESSPLSDPDPTISRLRTRTELESTFGKEVLDEISRVRTAKKPIEIKSPEKRPFQPKEELNLPTPEKDKTPSDALVSPEKQPLISPDKAGLTAEERIAFPSSLEDATIKAKVPADKYDLGLVKTVADLNEAIDKVDDPVLLVERLKTEFKEKPIENKRESTNIDEQKKITAENKKEQRSNRNQKSRIRYAEKKKKSEGVVDDKAKEVEKKSIETQIKTEREVIEKREAELKAEGKTDEQIRELAFGDASTDPLKASYQKIIQLDIDRHGAKLDQRQTLVEGTKAIQLNNGQIVASESATMHQNIKLTPFELKTGIKDIGVIDKDGNFKSTLLVPIDAVNEAFRRIAEKDKGGTQFQAGLLPIPDIDTIRDYAVIGAHKVEVGFRRFTDWSKEMLRNFGQKIKTFLSDIFIRSMELLDKVPQLADPNSLPLIMEAINKLGTGDSASSLALFAGAAATKFPEAKERGELFVAADQKERFEIYDYEAELSKEIKDYLETIKRHLDRREDEFVEGEGTELRSLPEVINHYEMFANYPEFLRNVRVKISNTRNSDTFGTSFTYRNNRGELVAELEINPQLIYERRGKGNYSKEEFYEAVKSTLLHEIQHHIQEIENFGRGINEENLLTVAKIAPQMGVLLRKELAEKEKTNETSDNAERRLRTLLRVHNAVEGDLSTLQSLHTELGKALKTYRDPTVSPTVRANASVAINTYDTALRRAISRINRTSSFNLYLRKIYLSSLGEIEAREVAERSLFTPEELATFFPLRKIERLSADEVLLSFPQDAISNLNTLHNLTTNNQKGLFTDISGEAQPNILPLNDRVTDDKYNTTRAHQLDKYGIDEKLDLKKSKIEDAKDEDVPYTKKEKDDLAKLAKLMEGFKPRRKGGRLLGTNLTATEYEALGDIRAVAKLSTEQTVEAMERVTKEWEVVEEKIQRGEFTDEFTPEKAEETIQELGESLYYLSTFGNINDKRGELLTDARNELENLIATGKSKHRLLEEERKQRRDQLVQEVINSIGVADFSTEAMRAEGLDIETTWRETIARALDDFDTSQLGMEHLLKKLFIGDKTGELTNKIFSKIKEASRREQFGTYQWSKVFEEKLREFYGRNSKEGYLDRLAFSKILASNAQRQEQTGIFVKQGKPGEEKLIEVKMSVNEAYKKWMEWQMPSVRTTLMDTQGYDLTTIAQIERFLPPEVLKWAKWQIEEFHPTYYKGVNEVFKRMNYVNLPFERFYSPIQREADRPVSDQELLFQRNAFATTFNHHLKSKVKNKLAVRYLDGNESLNSYVAQMEHFKAWGETMRELRGVFGNKQVRNSIEKVHGKFALKVIEGFLDDLARGGTSKEKSIQIVDKLRNNFTRAVLALNPTLFAKQLSSFPAFASEIPFSNWTEGLGYALSHPLEVSDFLMQNSRLMQTRYQVGIDRDVKDALTKKTNLKLAGAASLSDAAFFILKLGDKASIVLGGYPIYKYHYEKMISEGRGEVEARNEAIKQFELVADRTQQSGNIEDQSYLQRTGSIGKLFTMFQSQPNQYYRVASGAFRDLVLKRGDTATNLKRLAITHFILPMLFQFVADGFSFNENRQKRAALLGSFNGFLAVGDMIQTMAAAVQGDWHYQLESVPLMDVPKQFTSAMTNIYKMMEDDSIEFTEVLKVADDLASGSSKLVGVPYDIVKRTTEGVGESIDEEKLSLKTFGFSDLALRETKDALKKAKRRMDVFKKKYQRTKDYDDRRAYQEAKSEYRRLVLTIKKEDKND